MPDPTTAQIEELTLKVARRLTAVLPHLCGDQFETHELLAQTVVALQEALAAAVKPPLSPEQLELPGQGFEDPGKPPVRARGRLLAPRRTTRRGRGP